MKKIRLFDLIIVLLIAAVATVSFFVLKSEPAIDDEDVIKKEDPVAVKINYQVKFEGVEGVVADSLLDAPEFFYYDSDAFAGKVIHKSTEPHYEDVYDKSTGTVTGVEHPEKTDVFITFKSDAERVQKGIYNIGESQINHSKRIEFKGKFFLVPGIIYNIEEVK